MQVSARKYVLPCRFDLLEDLDEEAPHLVDGELQKLYVSSNEMVLQEVGVIITDRILRFYLGWYARDFEREAPQMQVPVSAIESLTQGGQDLTELRLGDELVLDFTEEVLVVKLADDFLPIYLSPNYGKKGLTCEVEELRVSESTKILVESFQVL